MPQHVIISDYNPTWPEEYEAEKSIIKEILKDNCIAVYHIGSTSVPSLPAKPIIDIMVSVRSLEAVDAVSGEFVRIGYEYLGEFGIEGRRYLRKGGDERTHQIHIFHVDDWENIVRHLAFRDYLRSHEEERGEYAQLKKKLASLYPYDIESYCDGKDEFVRKVERIAVSQYDDSWDRLYAAARKVQYPRNLPPLAEAGSVAAAIMTEKGNIYTGVCIDTACSIGMCAERNAIANMITNGENSIRKLAAVMPDGKAGMPCGVCREAMMQLSDKAADIQILSDYEAKSFVRLSDLLPLWWN